jgi:hypothetical protein
MKLFLNIKQLYEHCVLSLDVIINIINKQSTSNNGFESIHVIDEIQNLSLLFNMCVNSQFPIHKVFFNTTNF